MKYRIIFSLCVFVLTISYESIGQAQDSSSDLPPGLTIHVVQRGETLSAIAQQYPIDLADLALLNGITSSATIFVGQRLLVPISDDVSLPSRPETHIVQPGESLVTIARAYGTTLADLMAINDISDANRIYPGQILQLSDPVAMSESGETATPETTVEPTAPQPAPTNTPPQTDPPTEVAESPPVVESAAITDGGSIVQEQVDLHTVAAGETLFRIAQQYGLTVNDLVQANNLTNPTRIYVGQQLIIPGITRDAVTVDLPQPLTDLRLKPLIFVEGQTGGVQFTTASAVTASATFMDRTYPVITQEGGTLHSVLVGIPIFTEPGIMPFAITLTPDSGDEVTYTFNIRIASGGYFTQNINIGPQLAELLSPAAEEYETTLLSDTTSRFNPERYFDGPFSLPAAAAMNSPFGTRRSYNGGPVDRFHTGADFASAPGAPIYAAAPGQVVLADLLNIRGNHIIIDHGWGVYSAYSHLTTILVNPGDTVTTGQIIGNAGSTGRITGPHLHWEVWVNGVPVNPIQWTRTTFP